jgi:hypothetical protein
LLTPFARPTIRTHVPLTGNGEDVAARRQFQEDVGFDMIESLVNTYGHMYDSSTPVTDDDPEATSNRDSQAAVAEFVIAHHRMAGLVGTDAEIASDILGSGEGSRKCLHEEVSQEEYMVRAPNLQSWCCNCFSN